MKVIPGNSLKSYFPAREEESINIFCEVMRKLHKASFKAKEFPHIIDWLINLEQEWDIYTQYLHKAKNLKEELLSSLREEILLHGDLHHDNILQMSGEWVVIDPKGVYRRNCL